MQKAKVVRLVLFNMRNQGQIIYMDYNATTPVDPRVLEAMLPYFTENYANPGSAHHFGTYTKFAVDEAREQIASLIGADAKEIIFTSGSTESINIALKGVAENYSNKGKHIITVSTEHKAVIETCKHLESIGHEVSYLPVENDGLIDLGNLRQEIRPDTSLVCVMHVNNETGVIQPIKEISDIAHERGALFMCDATQSVGKIPFDVDKFGIDIACFSGHKMYAPKGIGALYVRRRMNHVKMKVCIHGGGQEQGLRSGTLNVPGIIALAKASQIALEEMKHDAERISELRNELERELLKIEGTFVNGNTKYRIFNTTNVCFRGNDANVLIGRMKNIAVSNGSACTASVVEPSHVLTAMGLSKDDAIASIRFSLGRLNNNEEIKRFPNIIKNIIKVEIEN
jgi:cysteine desulfurase